MSKKIIIFLTMSGLFFFAMVIAQKTYAQFIVNDPANTVQGTISATNDAKDTAKEFIIDTTVTNTASRLLNKLVDDTLNWANGYSDDGKPGYLNNWNDFIRGTSIDVFTNSIQYAGSVATNAYNTPFSGNTNTSSVAYNNCINQAETELSVDPTPEEISAAYAPCEAINETPENIAEANYTLFTSGNLNSPREVVETITGIAAATLSQKNRLDDLLSGKGETITQLLGSQERVDEFTSGNFSAGGWSGYIALGDPHNTKAGRASLIETELAAKIQEKENEALSKLNISQSYFFDKTKCEEYKIDALGNKTDECIRETILTPGGQVGELVSKSLNKEGEQLLIADELSDVVKIAVGRLTDGLLKAGVSQLTKNISNISPSQNINFNNVFQNEYDILGINEQTNEGNFFSYENTTNTTEEDGTFSFENTSLLSDSSIPTIDELEVILNIQTDLERSLSITKQHIENQTTIIKTLKMAHEDVRDLDRCIPGPDYNWEKRYEDLIDTTGTGYGGKFEDASEDNDEDEGVLNKIEKKEEEITKKQEEISNKQTTVIAKQAELNQINNLIAQLQAAYEEANFLQKPEIAANIEIRIIQRNNKQREIDNLKDEITDLEVDIRRLQNEIDDLIPNIEKPDNYTSPGINAGANKVALSKIKSMVNDPQINMPGASEMKSLINSYVRSGSQQVTTIQDELNETRSVLGFLNTMKTKIKLKYKKYITEKAQGSGTNQSTILKIPIFGEDWDKLSNQEKINIMNLSFINDQENNTGGSTTTNTINNVTLENSRRSYIFETKGSINRTMILNEQNGMTPTEYLEKNPENAKEIVLGYAWEILKEGMFSEVESTGNLSGKEQYYNILRYFFTIRNDIPSEQALLTGKVKIDTSIENNKRVNDYLHDCKVLRKFVTGHEKAEDGEILELSYSSGDHEYYNKKNGSAYMLHVNSRNDEYSYDYVFSSGISTSPTRQEILNFLTTERQKQENEVQSLFRTKIITSEENIEMSILSQPASIIRNYYYETYGNKPTRSIENNPLPMASVPAYDIQKMYERDYVVSRFTSNNRKVSGRTGLLFCWSEGDYSLQKKGKVKDADKVISECLKPWYYAKDIEYRLLFEGLND